MKPKPRRPTKPGQSAPAPAAVVGPGLGPGRGPTFAVGLLLVVHVWLVFGQTLKSGFVNYDDPANVTANAMVQAGLSWRGVAYAFTQPQVGHWDPLTTLSHMAVCHFAGLKAGAHHLANGALHAASAVLLFLVLRGLTGAFWRSALVAALWAVHPLRVESVAWITERKDVLCGLFFLLTLAAYTHYARAPERRGWWWAVVGLFLLGLLCKAMLVTLPAVLLLLDGWPLRRTGKLPWRALVLEKWPLFALSAAACVVQVVAAQSMIGSLEAWPLGWRLGNATVAYVAYVGQTFWPVGLAVYYPHPKGTLGAGEIALAGLLLAVATALAWSVRRRQPYVLVGWLWFLGMLVPVLGLVQSGTLARADRYLYLPQIGLLVAVVWWAVDWSGACPGRRRAVGAAALLALGSLVWQAQGQTTHWKDSHALWTQALAVTRANDVAHNNLGHWLIEQGRLREAEAQIRAALAYAPNYGDARNNLGLCLLARGQAAEAIPELARAVELRPHFAQAQSNLGMALLQTGETDRAIAHFQRALELEPRRAEVENNLAGALLQQGRARAAIAHYEKALALAPGGNALRNLAWVLATCPEAALRDGPRAVALARRAAAQSGGADPLALLTLSAAYAEAGQWAEAMAAAEQALRLPGGATDPLASRLRAQVRLLQNQTPVRDSYVVVP